MKFKIFLLMFSLSFSFASQAQVRVISAGANVTEIVIALGALDTVVAVDSTSRALVDDSIPVVGYHRALASEGLLSLEPTLLIGSEEMGPKNTLEVLSNAGVEISTLPATKGVDGLLERIAHTSKVLSKEMQGQALVEQTRAEIQSLDDSRKQLLETQVAPNRGMFVMSSDGRKMTVAGDKTSASELLHLAGIESVTSGHFESYKPLSPEAILELQPDVILISSHSLQAIGGVDAMLEMQPLLKLTPAGRDRRIVSIEGTALIGGVGIKTIELAQVLIEQQLDEL
ncbi:hemin ABC transporter substrate-binding protein [Alginatibacterium sediminis]|uniref:Hemin ABC transporter substrate-binding protein n=1 Tax=Alginatibacterium sediminis TaxID=2164068 RepID=A0A420EL73_9ALTE|nr:ABC transporter substrate-binding protein [Alginatibacterium sediminis]RKF21457.1 hemin ABC transporter substrate-binding protein [Alginatibacterium sediminis]